MSTPEDMFEEAAAEMFAGGFAHCGECHKVRPISRMIDIDGCLYCEECASETEKPMLELQNALLSEIVRALEIWNSTHADAVLGLQAVSKISTNPNFTGNYLVTLEKNHREIANEKLHAEFAATLPSHIVVK